MHQTETLRIFLGDVHHMQLDPDFTDLDRRMWWNRVESMTWLFFHKSVQRNPHISSVSVRHVTTPPTLQQHDILVYIVPNSITGVLHHHFGSVEKTPNQFGAFAFRPHGNSIIAGAEVYLRRATGEGLGQISLVERPWDVAKFIWHEAAHSKLGSRSLHRRRVKGHWRNRNGLAQAEFGIGTTGIAPSDRGTWISSANVRDMTDWMDDHRTMWTGGFAHRKKSGKLNLETPL